MPSLSSRQQQLLKQSTMNTRITITLDKELLAWLDARIQERVYANRSHGLELLSRKKMQEDERP